MNVSPNELSKKLEVSRQAIDKRAKRECWEFETVRANGGVQRRFIFSALPSDIRDAYQSAKINQLLEQSAPAAPVVAVQQASVVVAPTKRAAKSTGPTTSRQREIANARAAILAEIARLMSDLNLSRKAATEEIASRAKSGTLPGHIAALVPVANARTGDGVKRTLSSRTLYNWHAAAESGRSATGTQVVAALTPKVPQPSAEIPYWADDLLTCFQQSQNPSLRKAVRTLIENPKYEHLPVEPLYGQARRFWEKIGNAELQRGRMGPQARKAVLAFRRRKTGHMLPGDGYTADGHTFDAEIVHPEKFGAPFRPEMTAIVDIATRRIVGWSVNLAESTIAVMDALRNACETCGVPALFYTDRGPGYKNHALIDDETGLLFNLGITPTNSRPYNSQARGVMERNHKSVWVDAAKELPTYIGKDMDREMSIKVHKITRAEIKAGGRSKLMMEFRPFVAFAKQKVDDYNNSPHSALPKRYDESLGRKRHMTPNEAWAENEQAAKEAGLYVLSADDARDLVRPQITRVANRCEIILFNNKYFSKALEQHHGDRVRVAYDVRNVDDVIVYNQDGQYLCHAKLDGNASPYFAQPVIEQAQDKRTARRLKLHDAKRDAIEREFTRDSKTIENDSSPTLADLVGAAELVNAELVSAEVVQLRAQPARPLFATDADRYEWLMQNRTDWTTRDRDWLQEHITTESYTAMADYWAARGLQWQDQAQPIMKDA